MMETAGPDDGIAVWDPLVRIVHWALVATFLAAYLSGDDLEDFHSLAGYAVLVLVVLRVAWGFVGARHARFRDFVRGPAAVATYLRSLVSGHPRHYLGHNPAGGWMVLVLLAALFVTCWSGLEALAAEGKGPLARAAPSMLVSPAGADEGREHEDGDGELWGEVHEALANLMLVLIVVHVAGVLVASRLHHENLVRAMLTGRKPRRPRDHGP